MPSCEAKPVGRPRPPHVCGPPELYERSYAARFPFPFGDIDMVFESKPYTCDLFHRHKTAETLSATTCCDYAEKAGIEVEIAATVASFLSTCHRRPCRAVDLGANAGMVTTAMLSTGATVVSVEPQSDLASAVRETAALNCWSSRSTVFNAFACPWASAELSP